MRRPSNAPSHLSGLGDIRPYLSPEHWGGTHTIGRGETAKPPSLPVAAMLQALKLKMLNPNAMYLDTGDTQALETFGESDTFSAEDFDPGTMALYQKEVLEGKKEVTKEEIEESETLQRRIPADAIIEAADGEAPEEGRVPQSYIRDGDRTYVSTIYFGMVEAFGRSQKKTFLGYPIVGLLKHPRGTKLWTKTAYEVEPTAINVGEVVHFKRRGRESVQRINSLELHGYVEDSHRRESPLLRSMQVFGPNSTIDT